MFGSSAFAEPDAVAKAEIKALLDFLATSDCEFQRNGDWYPGERARAHIERKYRYLLRWDRVDTVEEFIELAATQSSMTGRAYQVRCEGKVTPSATWLQQQLEQQRSARNSE